MVRTESPTTLEITVHNYPEKIRSHHGWHGKATWAAFGEMDGPGELNLVFSGAYNLHNPLAPLSKVYPSQQIFNLLVTLFDSTLRNSPKIVGTKCFEAFGSATLLVLEIKLEAESSLPFSFSSALYMRLYSTWC